ncbi:hypothetical protein [Prosthecomicrobium pneumaticum]|uniref:Uncharacterized protein n=1 Tax=Prosthecomicrobium pneumaticum TaxID=81895 RepID=A0A7W9L1P2_9HYPH|nr:hypothetical protein [Prosthecomicrobium pneumaticum]MBB5752872.1 hypothetical protein [Prosthecomicrobium pneumaticum]
MTPSIYTDLQLVNATRDALYSGNGGSNAHISHSYQMWYWFGGYRDDQKFTSPLVERAKTRTHRLQFMRGVGDQTDAADMQINVGEANTGACNVVYVRADSFPGTRHEIRAEVQKPALPIQGPFIVALNEHGKWPADGATTLKWFAAGQRLPMTIDDGDQCMAIIDLGIFLPSALASRLVDSIAAGTFGGDDAQTVWFNVTRYVDLTPGN